MESFAQLLNALSGFAWPALIGAIIFHFRKQIASIYQLLRQQIASGGALKWKDFEFKGIDLSSFDTRGGSPYRQEKADKQLFEQRHEKYKTNRNLFLVHRVRPTGELHSIVSFPTYDISVYLISHKNFGKLNEIRKVEYYFGQHFGLSQGEYGTKFIVENGNDGFAVKVNAYGPMLCEARIVFHDKSEITTSRYLDFDSTDYCFRKEVNDLDQKKLLSRQEG